jgi:STE24 endopeptidase
MVLSIFMNALSRRNEYEADRFAAETVKNPDQLIAALKKLSVRNLANLTPHPLYVFLRYSHPPLLKRISALKACAPKRFSAPGGDDGPGHGGLHRPRSPAY